MTFEELINQAKSTLKEGLTAENTDLFTRIDKQLDSIAEAHKTTETRLSETQDKLLEVVKSYSFKEEGSKAIPGEKETEEVLTLDQAFDEAYKDVVNARKNK